MPTDHGVMQGIYFGDSVRRSALRDASRDASLRTEPRTGGAFFFWVASVGDRALLGHQINVASPSCTRSSARAAPSDEGSGSEPSARTTPFRKRFLAGGIYCGRYPATPAGKKRPRQVNSDLHSKKECRGFQPFGNHCNGQWRATSRHP